ncbi:alkene reductase [Cesiribacter andamanensis]|uniref:N-ethylmaleimide reductase n=1 Tax=Cesiribacter andamanensis AMV16 TaxID=1279009 RepID=M7NRK1_9BACT|nr:alkene reductase [Cesiribacter andamanensis]EMR01134.1 N-ethylmaleimide reductase [Cesiribacter andamanensis AMV16]
MNTKKPLLTPYTLNDLELKNRVVMAPLTRSRADNPDKAPTDLHAEYYRQRASAGLIISEGSQISEQAVGYINTPGIHTPAQVKGWKKVTHAVHEEGGKIFCQLWHVGRMSHPDFHGGALPLAPSPINPHAKSYTPQGFKDTVTPKEMSLEEIKQTIADFQQAGKNAMEAGFDGVEIHSSNGYLLHQFFNRTSNVRTDAYGGSIANRARILFEVIDALKAVMPEGRIGLRLNPSLHGTFGMELDEETIPTFDYIVKKLNDYQLAYLHLSEPFTDVSQLPHAEPHIARRYRPLYSGTLIINGGFDEEKGNEVIREGNADLVAFGKLFISNPDLPLRFEQGAPLQAWDAKTFYSPGAEGYIDYPLLEEVER